jgi:hypothetical protein
VTTRPSGERSCSRLRSRQGVSQTVCVHVRKLCVLVVSQAGGSSSSCSSSTSSNSSSNNNKRAAAATTTTTSKQQQQQQQQRETKQKQQQQQQASTVASSSFGCRLSAFRSRSYLCCLGLLLVVVSVTLLAPSHGGLPAAAVRSQAKLTTTGPSACLSLFAATRWVCCARLSSHCRRRRRRRHDTRARLSSRPSSKRHRAVDTVAHRTTAQQLLLLPHRPKRTGGLPLV